MPLPENIFILFYLTAPEGVCFVLTGFCENKDYLIDSGMIGALSRRLHDELTGIQWGTKLNPFG